jgi:NADH-quinone oxidoreductase subunit N
VLTNAANLFSSPQYLLSLPVILLTLFAAGVLLIDSVTPEEWKWMNAVTAMAGILFSGAGVMKIQFIQARFEDSGRRLEWAFGHTILVDHLTIYFCYLFLISAAITILTSVRQVQIPGVQQGAIYALILLSVVGMMCMVSGFDVIIIFVGLELMSVNRNLLAGRLGKSRLRAEAGLKVFLRGALSSAIFAGGLCLLWRITGSTNLQLISQGLQNIRQPHSIFGSHAVVILAIAITVAGLCFKVAAMPFHRWLLDACAELPASIAGFVVVASQTAGWAMLLHILLWGLYSLRAEYVPMLIVIAVFSIVGANIAALTQTSLTRLLGYSSIAQGAFVILGLVSLASVHYPAPAFFEGFRGILFYLLAYLFMNLGAFAVVESLPPANLAQDRANDGMEDMAGLFYRDPALAIGMTIFLSSLAGIPLVAGFYGKYFILQGLFASGHYVLAALAIVCSIAALYYYGRLAQVMFIRDPQVKPIAVGVPMRVALAILGFFTIAIGIYPKPLIRAVEWSLRLT